MKITEQILDEVMEADCKVNGEDRRKLWLAGKIKPEFLYPVLERNLRYFEHMKRLNEGKESTYEPSLNFPCESSEEHIEDICNVSTAAMAWAKMKIKQIKGLAKK